MSSLAMNNTTVVEEMKSEKPTSWNEAALQAVIAIMSLNYTVANKLSDMRKHLNLMISLGLDQHGREISNLEFRDYWKILGGMTRSSGEEREIPFFRDHDGSRLAEEISKILVKKQTDYGHDNISRFGRVGLLVRVHDKVARLENLTARGLDPANESLTDNYIDVIGYAAIGMMVENGTFLLDLEN